MQDNDRLRMVMPEELGYKNESLEKELKENLKVAIVGGYSKKTVVTYVERLKDTIGQMHANMEQQISDLVREKSELVQETSLLRQQLQETEELAKQNKEQVAQLQFEYAQLEEGIQRQKALTREAESLAEGLKEENENYKKIEELLQVRMEEQDKLYTEKRNLKVKLRTMEKEAERLETELDERVRLCQELEQKLAEADKLQATQPAAQKDDQVEQLLNQINLLEQKNALLQQQIQDQAVLKPESAEISAAQELQSQGISELEEQIEQLHWKLDDSKDALELQKGKYRELAAENRVLRQEKEVLHSQLQESSLKQEEKNASYERLQQKFNQLYQQSQELRLHLKQLEQERRAADAVIEKYQKQEKEYILLMQNNEGYLGEIENLENSIRFMFEQMKQQAEAFKHLSGQYEAEKKKVQELLEDKTDMQLRNVELIEQINKLNQQINDLELGISSRERADLNKKADQQARENIQWIESEFAEIDKGAEVERKTVNIGEIKKLSMEITNDIKERLNKQIGGM